MIGWTVTACVPGYIQKRESIFKFHVATPEDDFNEKGKNPVANRELWLP